MDFVRRTATWLDGFARCAKERYSVHLSDVSGGPCVTVAAARGTYYADPFLFDNRGDRWLFVEEFHCASNRAVIAAARVGQGLDVAEPQRALDPGCHTSFPFIFEHEGAVYLLPETTRAKSVDLYVCTAMPDRWRLAARLLDGVDCADSVVHRHDGLWYLITSQLAGKGGRSLAIYMADALVSQRWTPHPMNGERRYAGDSWGYGRNAGAIVSDGAALLRPMQASTRYYGEAARVMRIAELTPERFEEEPYGGDHVVQRIAATRSTHHISAAGGLVAWDTRTHIGYLRRTPERGLA